jgi:hypothetical protein
LLQPVHLADGEGLASQREDAAVVVVIYSARPGTQPAWRFWSSASMPFVVINVAKHFLADEV